MNNVEKQLALEKKRIDSITTPEELEMKLRHALNAAAPKRINRKPTMWKIAAVALIFMVIVGNHYNAFAFYSKKLLGFDEVIYGTIKELNDQGLGQIVDKKIGLKDGTELIINGIMNDANQLIMYYTLSNPKGLDDRIDSFRLSSITGFLTNSPARGGASIINEDHTEIKGTMSFEAVSPFAKKLTLHFWQPLRNDQMTEGSITFPYNPNKALKTQIKQSIKKTFKVDKGTITFNSIIATPTLTVIDGSLNVENFVRVNMALGGIELWANGIPIESLGSGSSSSLKGRKFNINFNSLPEQLDSLQLVIKEFVGYQLLKEKVSLSFTGDNSIHLNGKKLWVKEVLTTSQGVEITIATEEDVMLDGVFIETNNELTPIRTTVKQHYIKLEDGTIIKERTLLFDTDIEPAYLLIEGMHYMKAYNKVIEIPVK